MPTRLEKLQQASYKSVEFYVRKEDLNVIGQKYIQHDYPNTNARYMEPQGKQPFDSTIDLFFVGEDYIDDFGRFRNAVEEAEPGRLVMPTFGVFNNVVAVIPRVTANQKSVGEIAISVRFTETIEKPAPTQTLVVEEDVFEQGQTTRDALSDSFTEEYSAPTTLNNVLTAEYDFTILANSVRTTTGKIREALDFVRKVDAQIKNPEGLADLMLSTVPPVGLLQGVAEDVINTAEDAFTVFRNLAETGSDLPNSMIEIKEEDIPNNYSIEAQDPCDVTIVTEIPVWDDDTAERRARNTNRTASVNTFRVVGLIGMFEDAAQKDYTTTNQIDNIITLLNAQYTALIENDETGVVIPTIKSSIENLKGLTGEVLKTKRQNAYAVETIEIEKPMSASLLSYELYGEVIQNQDQLEFFADLIRNLNRSMPGYRLKGNVNVVELG